MPAGLRLSGSISVRADIVSSLLPDQVGKKL